MHVIYITGLGDRQPTWQIRAVMKTWGIYGITPHFFRVGWADGESLSTKLDRLIKLVDKLYIDEKDIGIVGVSAGASLALHAFATRPTKIAGVVTVCGKVQHPEKVGAQAKHQNPAFAESMAQLHRTTQVLSTELRKRILCVYPLTDHMVAIEDQYIAGAHTRRIYTFGHVFSIAIQILFGARKNINFLRKAKEGS